MASLADGLSNLFSSFFDILSGIFNGVLSALQSVAGLAQNVVASIFDLMSGFVGFVLGESFARCCGERREGLIVTYCSM